MTAPRARRAFASPLALLVGAGFALGCSDTDHRVPYRTGEPDSPEPTHTTAPEPPPARPFATIRSRALPPGTTQTAVDGAPIEYGGFVIEAVLEHDFDGDHDRDALVLLASETERAVGYARRDGVAFVQTLVGRAPWDARCTGSWSGRTIAPELALLEASTTCGAHATRELWPVVTVPTPSLGDRLHIRAPDRDTPFVAAIDVSVEATDVDSDGSSDLVLVAKVTPHGGAPASVRLAFANLPGGLAWDRAEPAAAIAELVRTARRSLGRTPGRAASQALVPLAFAAALCHDPGAALVSIGGARGLPCRPIPQLGRALAIRIAGLLREGKLLEAHETYRSAAALGIVVDPDNRPLVTQARDAATSPATLEWRSLGDVAAPARRMEALDMLFFESDDALVVRGAMVMRHPLATPSDEVDGGVVEHAAILRPDPGAPVADPTGALVVTDARRGCRGDVVPVTQRGSTRVVAEPVFAIAPAPLDPCTDTAPPRPARGTLLGWASAGLVFALGAELFVLPVDAADGASVPATPVGASAPSPVRGGAITSDGRAYVLSLGDALLVRSGRETTLLRGEPWASGEEVVRSVAIAPSARRVAMVRGRTLWVGSW